MKASTTLMSSAIAKKKLAPQKPMSPSVKELLLEFDMFLGRGNYAFENYRNRIPMIIFKGISPSQMDDALTRRRRKLKPVLEEIKYWAEEKTIYRKLLRTINLLYPQVARRHFKVSWLKKMLGKGAMRRATKVRSADRLYRTRRALKQNSV